MRIIEARQDRGAVRVAFEDGTHTRFSARWLLDNAPKSRHPKTNQRLVEAASLPEHLEVSSCDVQGDLLNVAFGHGPTHCFEGAFLRRYAQGTPTAFARTPWRAGVALPRVQSAALEAPEARREWLGAFFETGAALVEGVPVERGEVLRFAERFGFVRETNYGRLFDVESTPEPNHLAYADVPLALHTDNPYRAPVPGLQLLHCLAAAQAGGDTVLVDGLALAEHMRAEAPEAFDVLCRVKVPFRFRDETCDLRASRPLFELDADGEVRRVAFNDRSMAPMHPELPDLEAFYAAYRQLDALTKTPEMQVSFHLEPGELLLFDNERVLHARTGFDRSQGRRHLQGCYADRDAFESALRRLRLRPR